MGPLQTLIDKRNFHLFQPFLYQVATGGLSPEDIAAPLRSILSKQKNTAVIKAEVVDFDIDNQKVLLRDGELGYDTLIVATGMAPHYFSNDHWGHHAPPLKTVEDALDIRRRIFTAFEVAEREADPNLRNELMTFIIVGGGPTGVELAGAMAELTRETLKGEFRNIDPIDARVILIEALDRILPTYPEKSSRLAASALQDKGVWVRTETRVKEITDRMVTIEQNGQENQIKTRTVLWAAGMGGTSLAEKLAQQTGVETDRQKRFPVQENLTVPGHPEIFVIGDMARVTGEDGIPLPGVAQVAMQEGKYAARMIVARLQNKTQTGFHYNDKGLLSVIGRNAAVASIRGLQFNGFPAWLTWVFVHIWFLIEFNNKLSVMMQWMWNYITWDRGARLITGRERLPTARLNDGSM